MMIMVKIINLFSFPFTSHPPSLAENYRTSFDFTEVYRRAHSASGTTDFACIYEGCSKSIGPLFGKNTIIYLDV